MMNISTKSLLYKYWGFHNRSWDLAHKHLTLCYVFWMTAGLLIRDLVVSLALFLVASAPGPFIIYKLGIIAKTGGLLVAGHAWWIYALTIVFGFVAWALLILVVLVFGWTVDKFCKMLSTKSKSRKFAAELKIEMAREEPLGFGNLWQKMKIAKRDKFCPVINVIDK